MESTGLFGEANVALGVARENERERGEAKLIAQRVLLTEMAARLRIALFAEVRINPRPKHGRESSLMANCGLL